MIDPKTQKQPNPRIVNTPKSSSGKVAMKPATVPSHDVIQARAYELYERRGRGHGEDEQDWLSAEREILKQ